MVPVSLAQQVAKGTSAQTIRSTLPSDVPQRGVAALTDGLVYIPYPQRAGPKSLASLLSGRHDDLKVYAGGMHH